MTEGLDISRNVTQLDISWPFFFDRFIYNDISKNDPQHNISVPSLFIWVLDCLQNLCYISGPFCLRKKGLHCMSFVRKLYTILRSTFLIRSVDYMLLVLEEHTSVGYSCACFSTRSLVWMVLFRTHRATLYQVNDMW